MIRPAPRPWRRSTAREHVISSPHSEPKRTALHAQHRQLGARMVDFAGWTMPLQYDGLIKEHQRVRDSAGLFDVSHMGELFFNGPGAAATLDRLATNDVAGLDNGQVLYTPFCNPQGGVRDDVLVYRLAATRFMVVVNAANTAKILAWSRQHLQAETEIEDRTEELSLLALQGPQCAAILSRSRALGRAAASLEALPYYRFVPGEGDVLLVSRTGYTGERGFEIYVRAAAAVAVWQEILALGGERVGPAGLGARDTLRFEVGYCLYGHELDEDVSPLEAGLGWTVKWKKPNFLGKEALLAQRQAGPPRKLIGLEPEGRVIARSGCAVRSAGRVVGKVTSGTFAPSLERSLALALVQQDAVELPLELVIREREVPAHRVELPFFAATANH